MNQLRFRTVRISQAPSSMGKVAIIPRLLIASGFRSATLNPLLQTHLGALVDAQVHSRKCIRTVEGICTIVSRVLGTGPPEHTQNLSQKELAVSDIGNGGSEHHDK